MDFETIVRIILFGIALAMDAFAVSVTDGLIYSDINKKRIFFIASTFAIMQALMPVIGYFAVELVSTLVGNSGSETAIDVFKIIIVWVSFTLLLLIGTKMLIEGIIEIRKPAEEKESKKFSIREVLVMGVATAIDVSSYSRSDKTSTVNRFAVSMC